VSNEITAKSGLIQACGAAIYYEVAGEGPTLVLIHEGLADHRMYDDQFLLLARHCRVVRYDLHGFGRSGWPARDYTHHETLHELLGALEIEHATLLGMSLGGGVALDFALSHPEMVDALLLVAAGIGGFPQSQQSRERFAPALEAFAAGDFTRGIDLMLHIWVDGPRRDPDEVDPAIRTRLRALYTDVLLRTREGGRPPGALEPPAFTRLAEIHAPTLVVVGAGDIPDILEQADLLARTIPNVRKIALPRVAHLLNMEIPDEFNQLILDFLIEHDLAT
jgi:3-oxoadipate enol-lactonase